MQEKVKLDNLLRPTKLADYIGQAEVKEIVSTYLEATKQRKDVLDHTLLYGPPGLGKTTLAYIIANELGVNIHLSSGPAIRRISDIGSLVNQIKENDILFIDEIHRLPIKIEEVLYSAMEDFVVDLIVDKGSDAQPIRINIPRFTLIGATTQAGMLSKPFQDRFGIQERLQFYSIEELIQILTRSAEILKIEINDQAKEIIADCSRGTPRIANRLLRRIRDIAQAEPGYKMINKSIAIKGLDKLGFDEHGLDRTDRKILMALHDAEIPLALRTIASIVDEDPRTIEERHETFLLKKGFINKSSRGRGLTTKGKQCLHTKRSSNTKRSRLKKVRA